MTGRKIVVKNVTVKDGKVKPAKPRAVSKQIAIAKSKKTRVVRKGTRP